jgi:hypothetical protein
MRKDSVVFLSLFASLSTLICCALPALLVSLGLGASLVSLLGAVPQLIWFSEHKGGVFGGAGLLLVIGACVSARGAASCPTDPQAARVCGAVKKKMQLVYAASLFVYMIGGFFAFVAPWL